MANYVDGFVFPIPRDRLPAYKGIVEQVADIWKEHGALDYRECLGDDLSLEGTRSFTDLTQASDDEVVIFGWVEFASREVRDQANEKVMTDPRMEKLMQSADSGFDAERMAYGGFQHFVRASGAS